MQYPFEEIWKLLARLPTPDRGDCESWRTWYEKSWSYLGRSKLIEVNTHLDVTRVKFVALTLCWIVNDFVGAAYDYSEDYDLYWYDWLRDMEISPIFALVIATEEKPLSPLLRQAEIYQSAETEICDEEQSVDLSECESDLTARICAMVAMELRPRIIDALVDGYGDHSLLFANLYMASEVMDPVAHFLQQDLEDLDEIEGDLAEEEELINGRERLEARRSELLGMPYEDEPYQEKVFDELNQIEEDLEAIPYSIQNKEKLEKRREQLLRRINRDNIAQLAYDAAVADILSCSISIGSDDCNQRLKELDWCRGGFWIVNPGEPRVCRG